MRSIVSSLFLSAALLAGCAPTAGTDPASVVNAPVSKAGIAALEVSVTEAIRVANLCLLQRVGPCGVQDTRTAIIADEHAAADAFKQLQAAPASGQPAAVALVNSILSRLTTETPPIPAAK